MRSQRKGYIMADTNQTPIPAGFFRSPFTYPGIFEQGKDYPFENLPVFWDAVKELKAAGVQMNERALNAIRFASYRNRSAHTPSEGKPFTVLPAALRSPVVSAKGPDRKLPSIPKGLPVHVLCYFHPADPTGRAVKVSDRYFKNTLDAKGWIESMAAQARSECPAAGEVRFTVQDHALRSTNVFRYMVDGIKVGDKVLVAEPTPAPTLPKAHVVRAEKSAEERKQEAVNAALNGMAQALAALTAALAK